MRVTIDFLRENRAKCGYLHLITDASDNVNMQDTQAQGRRVGDTGQHIVRSHNKPNCIEIYTRYKAIKVSMFPYYLTKVISFSEDSIDCI